MSATVKGPTLGGSSKTQRKIARDVAVEKAITDGIEAQPTGPEDDNVPKSYFDTAPHIYGTQDPQGDEAFRDLLSLQPHFGPDQIMGSRPYDEGVLSYLANKRDWTAQ